MKVRTVAVVGAGTMGTGIAQVFATAGFDVALCDAESTALDRARQDIRISLEKLVAKGLVSSDRGRGAPARIRTVTTLAALGDADFLVEAISENRAAKTVLFSSLDAELRSEVVIASNTSSISISDLGDVTGRADRVCGMHFMNPVPLMPLVELIRGRHTSDETLALVRDLAAAVGKTVVEARDSPGFLTNRILMPMINEAAYALQEGVGTAEAIDAVMTLGMRHPMGPLRLADLIGLDVCVAILGELEHGLHDAKYRPCPLLVEQVAAGHLGRKTRRGFYVYD